MSKFYFQIDTTEIARKLNQAEDLLSVRLKKEVEQLSISAHAFIIAKANTELDDFKRKFFLGLNEYGKDSKKSSPDSRVDSGPRNVRWVRVSNEIWVVEIDEKAKWIEEGREATSMATEQWLLKPGSKGLKRAKDGSLYRAIPFTKMSGNKPKFNVGMLGEGPGSLLVRAIKEAAKKQKVSLSKVETDENGHAKLGVLHKLNVKAPGSRTEFPEFYSKPRTMEEAAATGLKPHAGHFHLAGATVVQRKAAGGKVKKETVVFRVVSSKHKNENRWMYPAVEPLASLPAALEHAEEQWAQIIQALEQEYARG